MFGEGERPFEHLASDLEAPTKGEQTEIRKPAPRAPSGETAIEVLHARHDIEDEKRKKEDAEKIEQIRQSIDNIDKPNAAKELSPWDEDGNGIKIGGSVAEVGKIVKSSGDDFYTDEVDVAA